MVQRVISEEDFRRTLETLARLSVVALSLKAALAPLTPEEIAAGAEPADSAQVIESLDEIAHILTVLALKTLKATREEWYAANDMLQ